MPWKESSVSDQRIQFVARKVQGESITDLCQEFGISRTTAYKWCGRYHEEGPVGLVDRSRAPLTHPHAMSEDVSGDILDVRTAHPTWGAKKIRQYLQHPHPHRPWPAASSIGDLLAKQGLTRPRGGHRRRTTATPTRLLTLPLAPHQVWCMDFKGWFVLGNGQTCYPFTLTEAFSRYLLQCQALPRMEGGPIRTLLETTFRLWGLPEVIRSDNGTPFASTGLGGLSYLSVWLLRLGIRPERIRPGHPEENGQHERFHRTLNEDVTHTPCHTGRAQQQAFDRYRLLYNKERPHAALEGLTPAQVLTGPSLRPFPAHLPPFLYPAEALVRRVRPNGCVKWHGQDLYVTEALIGQDVGLLPLTNRHWRLLVGGSTIAVLDEADRRWVSNPEMRRLLQLCGEEMTHTERS